MENAADALKMAAAVLIFVAALSITINSFTETRIAATTIMDYKDRKYDYTYVDENGGSTKRIVSLDSIIPSIYKAYKENYKIIFDKEIVGDEGIYSKRKDFSSNVFEPVFSIDLQKETLGNETQKEQFITAVLYGCGSGTTNKTYKKANFSSLPEDFNVNQLTFENNMGIRLNTEGIYDKINTYIRNGNKIEESLGIYYQEEVKDPDEPETTTGDSEEDDSDVPEANKTEKRVITYSEYTE